MDSSPKRQVRRSCFVSLIAAREDAANPSEGLIRCKEDSQTSEPHYNARADGPAFGLLLAAQAAAALWLLTAKSEKPSRAP